VQLARYLIDYMGVRLEHMRFAGGRVVDFGLPEGERDAIVASGLPFRTSGCPGTARDDVSACDRPYGDSPPSNIASYPFAPARRDIARIQRQLGGGA
jgi:biotin synthase